MSRPPKNIPDPVIVAAVSGGPDSVYLLHELVRKNEVRIVVGHVNHGARGKASDKDQVIVDNIADSLRLEKRIHLCKPTETTYAIPSETEKGARVASSRGNGKSAEHNFPPGFEEKARTVRHAFLKRLAAEVGAEKIAMAHTADDQVETILMRVFEGAGIGGLKGIPRETNEGIVRPILDVWKEDILAYLKKRKIPYRIDRSNFDTRFERNWVRHVLIPLLETRYGKGVKKRIFALGERFREIDEYLEAEARRWIRRNEIMQTGRRDLPGSIKRKQGGSPGGDATNGFVFQRSSFSALPTVLRRKILQRICFDRLGVSPNERLLKTMDRNVKEGGPSARVSAGKGWILDNRYEESRFLAEENHRARRTAPASHGNVPRGKESFLRQRSVPPPVLLTGPGEYDLPPGRQGGACTIAWEARDRSTVLQARRLAAKGDAEVFDTAGLAMPLVVRRLRAGDRIRPFGGGPGGNARIGGKKVKEILIDRKVPRGDRWGRPVVCDASGAILWIPGVLRSGHAAVTPETRNGVILRVRPAK